MALQAAYKQFLAAPNSSALAADASLHYITSTTSYNGATDIIKHLSTVRNQIRKKKENVLFVIEGQNAVVLEAELAIEFVSSGGPYLPGLDDNFLADRTISFPITHIVTFDADNKIQQIRQSWDQGSLLKQLEVIGKSGRNWPIRDSKDQINLITKCVQGGGAPSAVEKTLPIHNRANSTNILRDPHASLSLFASREEVDKDVPAVVSPYAGRRPTQRSFTEILGDEDEEPGSPSNGRERSVSPNKAKMGAGKNFQPVRLFDRDEDAADPDTPEKGQSPDRLRRPDPKKYQHFDFDDGSENTEPAKPAAPPKKTKHNASWGFEDFVTPQKPTASRTLHKARDVRHWGTGSDVAEETPVQKPTQAKGRINAESHFDFVDDGETPAGGRFNPNANRPRGTANNEGQHLYDMNLYNEDGSAPTPGPAPLGNITNLGGRRKDFAPHFGMTDESPKDGPKVEEKLGDDRKKAIRTMESNWSTYDVSPAQKENSNPNNGKKVGDERGIVTAGDGMGGKKGAGRGWGFGDDSDEEQQDRVPGKKQGRGPPAKADSFWDF
ncbi:hypothetical protein QBC35DRAFT_501175 [Podospora australis]|uniref:NTF2-like protein n=1 Tax=Podospora australis TaxID=1536484 RepID=A0AAN6WS28_9PEZI|nr:hypothetical protein QBC35DRAFT_501175 [Podospora australis]